MRTPALVGLGAITLLSACGAAQQPEVSSRPPTPTAQEPATLTPELLEALRRGPSAVSIPDGRRELALVGRPTLPLLETRINGHGPYRLLVDLGSNVILLRRAVADAAGVEILLDRPTTDILRIDSLSIGGARFDDVYGAAYDELDVDGVIGYNLLRHRAFTVALDDMRFVFEAEPLVWTESSAGVLPFVIESRMPYVRAHIGPDTFLVNLDTGASEQLTFPADWQGRFAWDSSSASGPMTYNNQTGAMRVSVGWPVEDLWIGPVRVAHPEVHLNPDAEDAWIGSGLLRRFTLTVDPARQLLRLVPVHQP